MSTGSHIVRLWMLMPLAYCLIPLHVYLEGWQRRFVHLDSFWLLFNGILLSAMYFSALVFFPNANAVLNPLMIHSFFLRSLFHHYITFEWRR